MNPSQDILTFKLLCPDEKAGGVIGKGGSIVKALQHESGCEIKVLERLSGSEDRVIIISGPAHPDDRISAPQDAALRVQTRIVRAAPEGKEKTVMAKILVASDQIGCLLGKGGAVISEMRKFTGAYIRILGKDQIPKCASENEEVVQITDACSACFEQRTVFTQQVLAKALNQMVDQTPLPMLFMTVIQAIDAFPTLVDFVMEILLKLVGKQVWRMPKLWVGFLKFVSQTQPHSFRVLLQLPSPQLEGALKKFASLRGPLTAYANQPSIKTSLPRATVALLGLANEKSMQQPHRQPSLHSSEQSCSIHGATPT